MKKKIKELVAMINKIDGNDNLKKQMLLKVNEIMLEFTETQSENMEKRMKNTKEALHALEWNFPIMVPKP